LQPNAECDIVVAKSFLQITTEYQMQLKDYMEQNGLKSAWFAKKIPITIGYFSNIMNRGRKISPMIAIRIEQLTNGDVTMKDWQENGQG